MIITLDNPREFHLEPNEGVPGTYTPFKWEYEQALEHGGWSWLTHEWPELRGLEGLDRLRAYATLPDMSMYGTFDSLDFFRNTELWANAVASPWRLILTMVGHDKQSGGGIRFHKNGSYYGDKREGFEHFFDEPNIDVLYTFRFWRHIKE